MKLKYDEPLSNFAFKFNLRRYNEEEIQAASRTSAAHQSVGGSWYGMLAAGKAMARLSGSASRASGSGGGGGGGGGGGAGGYAAARELQMTLAQLLDEVDARLTSYEDQVVSLGKISKFSPRYVVSSSFRGDVNGAVAHLRGVLARLYEAHALTVDAVLSAADKFGADGAEAGGMCIFETQDSAHDDDGNMNRPSVVCAKKRKAMVDNAVRRLRHAAHALWLCEEQCGELRMRAAAQAMSAARDRAEWAMRELQSTPRSSFDIDAVAVFAAAAAAAGAASIRGPRPSCAAAGGAASAACFNDHGAILAVLGAVKREVEGFAADFQRLAAHAMPPPPVMTSWGTVAPERAWRKRNDDGGGDDGRVPKRRSTSKGGAGAAVGVPTWRFSGGDGDDGGGVGGGDGGGGNAGGGGGGDGGGGVDSMFGPTVGGLSDGGEYIDRAAAQRRDRVMAQRRAAGDGAAECSTWMERWFSWSDTRSGDVAVVCVMLVSCFIVAIRILNDVEFA